MAVEDIYEVPVIMIVKCSVKERGFSREDAKRNLKKNLEDPEYEPDVKVETSDDYNIKVID